MFRDLNHCLKFNGENYNEYQYEILMNMEQLGLRTMLEPVDGVLLTCPLPVTFANTLFSHLTGVTSCGPRTHISMHHVFFAQLVKHI